MKNFWYWHAEAVLAGLFFVLAVGAVALCIYGAVAEGRAWEEFAAAHDCKVTGRITGDVVTGFSSNGSVVTAATPDKTAYTCNDGVTYWR